MRSIQKTVLSLFVVCPTCRFVCLPCKLWNSLCKGTNLSIKFSMKTAIGDWFMQRIFAILLYFPVSRQEPCTLCFRHRTFKRLLEWSLDSTPAADMWLGRICTEEGAERIPSICGVVKLVFSGRLCEGCLWLLFVKHLKAFHSEQEQIGSLRSVTCCSRLWDVGKLNTVKEILMVGSRFFFSRQNKTGKLIDPTSWILRKTCKWSVRISFAQQTAKPLRKLYDHLTISDCMPQSAME